MKEKYNLKLIIAGLICTILGVMLILLDIFVTHTQQNLWISIGCSLIASGVVSLLTALFVERVENNPLDEWKIVKIYATRAEKNADSDPELDKAKYCIDVIAFGLKSFRTKQDKRVDQCLQNGVNIRIMTMDSDCTFISQREKEENENEGQIKNTIGQLIKWANDKNRMNHKGKIIIKSYNCMTHDFYWRVDDELYVGPYWYGYDNQQTLTQKFMAGGKGFSLYSEYFEKMWYDNNLTKVLTEVTSFNTKEGEQSEL